MVDLIVYEEQVSQHLIVVNLRIIIHRVLYKKGQCIKISNVENSVDKSPFNVKNYVTNVVSIVNNIELNIDVETPNKIKSISSFFIFVEVNYLFNWRCHQIVRMTSTHN